MIHVMDVDSKSYPFVMGDIVKEFHEMQRNKGLGNKKEVKRIKISLNEKVEKMGLSCPNPDCKCRTNMKFYTCYERGLDSITDADLSLELSFLEIVRVQCRSCEKTQALLPCDVIPYCRATVDTVILTELSRQRINKELAQSDVFADKVFQGKPVVNAAEADVAQNADPSEEEPSMADFSNKPGFVPGTASKSLRERLVVENGHVFIDKKPLKQGVLRIFTDSDGAVISLSTIYRWANVLVDGTLNCFNSCVDVLRRLDLWNKGTSPSLGELCALLLTNPFFRIQEKLISCHDCPFLFRLSRRTVSKVPFTGFAYCIH